MTENGLVSDSYTGKYTAKTGLPDSAKSSSVRADHLLIDSDTIYQTIFEHTGTAMLMFEEDAGICMVNQKLADILGYTKDELEGKRNWGELVPRQERKRMLAYAQRRRCGDKSVPSEYESWFIRKDGSLRRGMVNISVLPETGKTLASVVDITDRHALQEKRKQYEFIVDASQDSMNLIDASYTYRAVNAAALRVHGKSRQELIGRTIAEVWGEEEFQKNIKPKLDTCLSGKAAQAIFSTHLAVGGTRHFSAAFYPYFQGEKVTHIVVVSRDITEEKKLADNVGKSEDSLKQAQRIAHLGNWDWDIGGKELIWSDELYRIFGVQQKTGGVPFRSFLQAVHPEDRREVNRAIKLSLVSGKTYEKDFRIIRPDGSIRHIHADTEVIQNCKKKPVRMIGTVLDITERKLAEIESEKRKARLDYLALHDDLTGLPNRAFLTRHIEAAKRLRKADNYALIYIGIDQFKAINEALGHHAGDQTLKSVAERLNTVCREMDILVRMGGDVFALLLTPLKDREHLIRVIKNIQQLFSEPLDVGGFSADIEVSLGISLHLDEPPDCLQVPLHQAEVAMYAAKQAHSPYLIYESEMEQFSLEHLALASELKHAIIKNELVLHYQPQVSATTGALTGVESLLRWNHLKKGLISPNLFVPMAEQTGLIHPITKLVAKDALRQQGLWQQQGIDLIMSINLAAPNLQDLNLTGDLEKLVMESHLSPKNICFEITERTIMADVTRSLNTLTKLHKMGFKLSIDDFGTGYSSLAYLKDMPVDEVKIDRSFILDMHHDEKKSMLVRTIIELAHNLGFKIVTEGVEDAVQWQMLKEFGCDIIQGYLVSRPLQPAQFEKWLGEYTQTGVC